MPIRMPAIISGGQRRRFCRASRKGWEPHDPHAYSSHASVCAAFRSLCALLLSGARPPGSENAGDTVVAALRFGIVSRGRQLHLCRPDGGRADERRLCSAAERERTHYSRSCRESENAVTKKLDPRRVPWMSSPETQAVMRALTGN